MDSTLRNWDNFSKTGLRPVIKAQAQGGLKVINHRRVCVYTIQSITCNLNGAGYKDASIQT